MMQHDKTKDDFIESWRGIAVMLVVYFHYVGRVPASTLGLEQGPRLPFYSGNLGVLIFFVISGFLITKSLSFSKSLADFYAKRLSRLWPLFIAASVLIFTVVTLFDPLFLYGGDDPIYKQRLGFTDLIGTLFFLRDLGFSWVDGAFWSILVELKFYAYIGLLAAVSPRYFSQWLGAAAFTLAFIQLGLEIFMPDQMRGVIRLMNGVAIAHYLPFFAIGVLLCKRDIGPLLGLNALMAILFAIIDSSRHPDFELLGTISFLFAFTGIVALDAALLRHRIFTFIGKYSYSLYLFHQVLGLSIIYLLAPKLGLEGAVAAAFTGIFILAIVMSWLFEWRYRRLVHNGLMTCFAMLKLDRFAVRRIEAQAPTPA